MADKLSDEQVSEKLSGLDGWNLQDGCLIKEFKFKDFPAAMKFMNALAPVAERLNHHPDWSNSYNKVRLSLSTHSVDGLSEKDFALATSADKIYEASG